MAKEARTYNGEKTVSLISSAGKTGQLHVKNEIRTFSYPYTKINAKQIKDVNVTLGTIKFLEENIGKTLIDINHRNIFLDSSPKAKESLK